MPNTIVQKPQALLTKIVGELFAADQSRFRLVCTSWRDALPAAGFQHRVTIPYKIGWEGNAAALRTSCPQISVVLLVNGVVDLVPLLQNPLCDIISYHPQNVATMSQWVLQTFAFLNNSFSRNLKELKDLADLLHACSGYRGKLRPDWAAKLELSLRLRSGHVVKDVMQKELMRLKAMIVQIRKQEQLIVTANVMFQAPMISLRVFAFSLARKPNDQTTLQNAVRRAPNLEFLQIYVDTAVTAQRALKFVGVLPELPKVRSLRLATKGNAICLPVECLLHVTLLELGTQVSFTQTPPQLCNLSLEKLDLEYEGYPAMMSSLCKSGAQVSVSLSSFAYAALPSLPVTVDKLSLLQKLQSGAQSVEDMIALPLALARLSGLRALYLADFLTGFLLGRLSAGHFPKLHTLGISFICQESSEYQSVDRNTGKIMLRPTESLLPLVQYFPNLECLQVSCFDREPRIVVLDAYWIDKAFFPKLSGVTFCCPHVTMELANLPEEHPCIKVVYKS